jgi:hypothetical protein
MRTAARLCGPAVALLVLAGCDDGGGPDATTGPEEAGEATAEDADAGDPDAEQRYPDVVDAGLERDGDTWRLNATLSSPYDTPERYADAFRALGADGEVLGVRELLHHHADEQPFTRSLDDLAIPEGVDEIVVEGRDLEHGWGGGTVTVEVPEDGGEGAPPRSR